MISKRLIWFLERHNVLSTSQSGFRRQRSTLDHILALHDDAVKSISNGRYLVAVFLDFERAYDMVWRDGLLSKLFGLGLRGRSLRWIRAFLGNRTARVRVGTCFSNWFELQNGLVQGSAISPILFTVMINDYMGIIIDA